MPIEVDSEKRMRELAEATLRVAERDGPGAITIRRVAAELGGSTAVVTNYAASRELLLLNAMRHVQDGWRDDLAAHLDGVDFRDLLLELLLWSIGTVDHDHVIRQIWLAMAARAEPDSPGHNVLKQDADFHLDQVRTALRESANDSHAEVDADALYLMLRGYYFLSVEDPTSWTEERVAAAIRRAVERLPSD